MRKKCSIFNQGRLMYVRLPIGLKIARSFHSIIYGEVKKCMQGILSLNLIIVWALSKIAQPTSTKKRRGGLGMRNSLQPLPWCCYCADLIINSQFFPLWFRSVRSFFLFLCINCYISLSWYFKPRFLLDMIQWNKLTDRLVNSTGLVLIKKEFLGGHKYVFYWHGLTKLLILS